MSSTTLDQQETLSGPPKCLSETKIASICSRHLDDKLANISHQRISSFRDSTFRSPIISEFRETLTERGIFRILLTSESGREWSLICKNDPRPADMSEFQQRWFFGNFRLNSELPTEALIYRESGNALANMIPDVYSCDELRPGTHYQYLLADLCNFKQARSSASVLSIVAMLPRLHNALRDWSAKMSPERLSRCDALHEKHTDDIDRYARESKNPRIATFSSLWHLLLELAETPAYQGLKNLTAIHGDLWLDNILVHPSDPERTRFIDWESVVRGKPHSDLALLLMRERPAIEEQALSTYANNDKSMSLSEHWQLYRWCKLEYCLIKAIDCARSYHQFAETPELKLPYYADHAIRQARFYNQLIGSATHDREPSSAIRDIRKSWSPE